MLFYWPKLLYPYHSLQLFFPFRFSLSIGWYCGAGVFGLIGCRSFSLGLPTFLIIIIIITIVIIIIIIVIIIIIIIYNIALPSCSKLMQPWSKLSVAIMQQIEAALVQT